MSNLSRRFILTLVLLTVMMAGSVKLCAVRIHCSEDSIKVMEIMTDVSDKGGSLGDRMLTTALLMQGIKTGGSSDNDSIGTVMVNLHTFDPLDFINQVFAIAKTAGMASPSFEIYKKELESISRRKGEDKGFPSKLFYGADWIVDNVFRGNLQEMTEYFTGGGFKTKTLDHLSRNREQYPALKDSASYENVKMMEMGYRSHRIPHMKKQSISNKQLHQQMNNGDIIMMLAPDADYDIYDIGVIEIIDGQPYLIHLNKELGEVSEDPYPASRLFKIGGQHFYGYRWLRPAQ